MAFHSAFKKSEIMSLGGKMDGTGDHHLWKLEGNKTKQKIKPVMTIKAGLLGRWK
jgi:hypothetical protein